VENSSMVVKFNLENGRVDFEDRLRAYR
jgi:hypothetical protein